MGFPLVIGSKSVSSTSIPPPNCHPESNPQFLLSSSGSSSDDDDDDSDRCNDNSSRTSSSSSSSDCDGSNNGRNHAKTFHHDHASKSTEARRKSTARSKNKKKQQQQCIPLELYQTIAIASCPYKEWSVRVVVSYYDLYRPNSGDETNSKKKTRNDNENAPSASASATASASASASNTSHRLVRTNTMAEVRIQIAPLGRPISWHGYRQLIHHFPLPDASLESDRSDASVTTDASATSDTYTTPRGSPIEPKILLSLDRKSMALLVFHPHHLTSALIFFQLRVPRPPLLMTEPIRNTQQTVSSTVSTRSAKATSTSSIHSPLIHDRTMPSSSRMSDDSSYATQLRSPPPASSPNMAPSTNNSSSSSANANGYAMSSTSPYTQTTTDAPRPQPSLPVPWYILANGHVDVSITSAQSPSTTNTETANNHSGAINSPNLNNPSSLTASSTVMTQRSSPRIATNPKILSTMGITAICNIPNVSPPLLLAACYDGHYEWIDYRSCLVIASTRRRSSTTTTTILQHSSCPVEVIKVSPTSCFERGTMIAIRPSLLHTKKHGTVAQQQDRPPQVPNETTTTDNNIQVLSWRLESSSSSVQHTNSPRASTGTSKTILETVRKSKSWDEPLVSESLQSSTPSVTKTTTAEAAGSRPVDGPSESTQRPSREKEQEHQNSDSNEQSTLSTTTTQTESNDTVTPSTSSSQIVPDSVQALAQLSSTVVHGLSKQQQTNMPLNPPPPPSSSSHDHLLIAKSKSFGEDLFQRYVAPLSPKGLLSPTTSTATKKNPSASKSRSSSSRGSDGNKDVGQGGSHTTTKERKVHRPGRVQKPSDHRRRRRFSELSLTPQQASRSLVMEVFENLFAPLSSSTSSLDPTWCNTIMSATFCASSQVLAVLYRPGTAASRSKRSSTTSSSSSSKNPLAARVYAKTSSTPSKNKKDSWTLLSQLEWTPDRLEDVAHCTNDGTSPNLALEKYEMTTSRTTSTCGIEYDEATGCLILSTMYFAKRRQQNASSPSSTSKDEPLDGDTETSSIALCSLGCLWDWRTRVVGFVLPPSPVHSYEKSNYSSTKESNSKIALIFSQVAMAHDPQLAGRLVHMQAYLVEKNNRIVVKQTVYPLAIVSPPSHRNSTINSSSSGSGSSGGAKDNRLFGSGGTLTEPTSIVLSGTSVMVPVCTKPTACDTMHVEWMESVIPPSYVSSFGPPRIAAIGRLRQNAIAVASSSGICILMDIQPKRPLKVSLVQKRTKKPHDKINSSSAGQSRPSKRRPTLAQRTAAAAASASTILKPKWRLFGNETEERQFRVTSMAWWEGGQEQQMPFSSLRGNSPAPPINEEDYIADDLLVALIECNNGRQYLSCWSPKRLDLAHQLIECVQPDFSSNNSASYNRDNTSFSSFSSQVLGNELSWGLLLPKNFAATSLSLLSEPVMAPCSQQTQQRRQRRAVVLVSVINNDTNSIEYVLIQLEVVSRYDILYAQQGSSSSILGESNSNSSSFYFYPRAESYLDQRPYTVLSQIASGNNNGDMVLQLKAPTMVSTKAQTEKSTSGIVGYSSGRSSHSTGAAVGPASTIFLASASFRFDLFRILLKNQQLFQDSFRFSSTSYSDAKARNEYIATVGIIRMPGGLEAVALSGTGVLSAAMVVDSTEISTYWLSDIVFLDSQDHCHKTDDKHSQGCRGLGNNIKDDEEHDRENVLYDDDESKAVLRSKILPCANANKFVWSLELLSGELVSWSVPFLCDMHASEYLWFESPHLSPILVASQNHGWPVGLLPPTYVYSQTKSFDENGSSNTTSEDSLHLGGVGATILLGIVCSIGAASDWMHRSSSSSSSSSGGSCNQNGSSNFSQYKPFFQVLEDIPVGPVPGSSFGCILSTGQSFRTIARHIPDGFGTHAFAALQPYYEVYCPADCLMKPPAFLPSLYALCLEAAYIRTTAQRSVGEMAEAGSGDEEHKHQESVSSALDDKQRSRIELIQRHIIYRLNSAPNKDSVMMALRLMIFRAVDILTCASKKKESCTAAADVSVRIDVHADEKAAEPHNTENEPVETFPVRLATSLFAEVVDCVRCCTTDLQFAALFLEVGRQVEPGCFANLFPLPLAIWSNIFSFSVDSVESKTNEEQSQLQKLDASNFSLSSTDRAQSVVDLLRISMGRGSLAASVSALPLLGTKGLSRKYCEELLLLSLRSISKNLSTPESVYFDVTLEDRRILGDIFRYAVKLEDATGFEEMMFGVTSSFDCEGPEANIVTEAATAGASSSGRLLSTYPDSNSNTNLSGESSAATHDSGDHVPPLICNMGGTQGSILNYIVPSIFSATSNLPDEEEAIAQAATSFIQNGFDEGANVSPKSPFRLGRTNEKANNSPIPTTMNNGSQDVTTRNVNDVRDDLKTVAAVVGSFVVDLLRSGTSGRRSMSWTTMACIARLLLDDSNNATRFDSGVDSTAARTFREWMERVVSDDMEFVLPKEFYDEAASLDSMSSSKQRQKRLDRRRRQSSSLASVLSSSVGSNDDNASACETPHARPPSLRRRQSSSSSVGSFGSGNSSAEDLDHYHQNNRHYSQEEVVVRFLVVTIACCRHELTNIQDANKIVDLVFYLLHRLEEFPPHLLIGEQDFEDYGLNDFSIVWAGLILVGMIAGTVSDRANELMQAAPVPSTSSLSSKKKIRRSCSGSFDNFDEDSWACFLQSCYRRATTELISTV